MNVVESQRTGRCRSQYARTRTHARSLLLPQVANHCLGPLLHCPDGVLELRHLPLRHPPRLRCHLSITQLPRQGLAAALWVRESSSAVMVEHASRASSSDPVPQPKAGRLASLPPAHRTSASAPLSQPGAFSLPGHWRASARCAAPPAASASPPCSPGPHQGAAPESAQRGGAVRQAAGAPTRTPARPRHACTAAPHLEEPLGLLVPDLQLPHLLLLLTRRARATRQQGHRGGPGCPSHAAKQPPVALATQVALCSKRPAQAHRSVR